MNLELDTNKYQKMNKQSTILNFFSVNSPKKKLNSSKVIKSEKFDENQDELTAESITFEALNESVNMKKEFLDVKPVLVCEPNTGIPIAITYLNPGQHTSNNSSSVKCEITSAYTSPTAKTQNFEEKPLSITDKIYYENGVYFANDDLKVPKKMEPLDEITVISNNQSITNEENLNSSMLEDQNETRKMRKNRKEVRLRDNRMKSMKPNLIGLMNLRKKIKDPADEKIVQFCEKCAKSFGTPHFTGTSYMRYCPKCKSKVQFKCLICQKLFSQMSRIRRHVQKTCDPREFFKCTYCDYATTAKNSLRKHYRVVHTVEPTENDFQIVSSKSEYCRRNIHRKSHYCNDCEFVAYNKVDIKVHVMTKHSVDPKLLYCPKCARLFEIKVILERHIATCGLMPYRCKYCDKSWQESHKDIKLHLMSKHAKEIETVGFDVIMNEILNRAHQLRDDITKSIYAENKNSGKFKNDAATYVPDEMVKINCKKCVKQFEVKREKSRKFLKDCPSCGRILQFNCVKCGKSFSSIHSAKAHVRRVCVIKQYFKCTCCTYTTSYKSQMINHMERVHRKLKANIGERCFILRADGFTRDEMNRNLSSDEAQSTNK